MATIDDILQPAQSPKERYSLEMEQQPTVEETVTPQNSVGGQPVVPAGGTTQAASPKEQGIVDRMNEVERRQQQQQPAIDPMASYPKRQMSYTEMVQRLSPYKPPTQEELEAERKRRRRNAVFAAIGDGISALSNLYFTTQYAPNSYNAKNSLSERMLERWDKIDKERQANSQAYFSQYLRAQQMDDNAAEKEWGLRYQIDKDKKDAEQKAEQMKYEREAEAAKAAVAQANKDREYALDVAKAENDAKYKSGMLANARQRTSIAKTKAANGGSSSSSGKGSRKTKEYIAQAWKEWNMYTPKQQAEWRSILSKVSTNAKGKQKGKTTWTERELNDDFVVDVMEDHAGWKAKQGKKTIPGFGGSGSASNGKKNIPGFGTK